MTNKIQLPNKKLPIETVNPKRLVVYSKPKTGKTTAFSMLENNLIIDLEDGTDYVEALKIKVNSLEELKAVGEEIKAQKYPYKYITVDTVTILEDLVMPLALGLYKETPMGKNFTQNDVLKLANGAGYQYLREAFFNVLDYIDTLAPYIILSGHIKDKLTDDTGKLVESANIDLKGKIRDRKSVV